jgi:hypothetical protein
MTVLAAERAIVRDRFGRSVARYRATLTAAGVTLADARAVIADRLGRERVEQRFKPRPATARQIGDFLSTYGATRVRLVSLDEPAPWLGDAYRGYAVETIAPAEVFALPFGKRRAIDTVDGRFFVRALGPALPLYALAPSESRNVARGLLARFAKDEVYDRWLRAQELQVLRSAVCVRDDVPAAGRVDLTAWLPFLGA